MRVRECPPKTRSLSLKTTLGGRTVSVRGAVAVVFISDALQDGWAFLLSFTAPMWTLTGCEYLSLSCTGLHGHSHYTITDDSAAHVSEETAGAAKAAPIAILFGVGVTASLGWLLYIAASFATASVTATMESDFPLLMGQLFLDVLGKRGMLAIWSCIIVVQARHPLLRQILFTFH